MHGFIGVFMRSFAYLFRPFIHFFIRTFIRTHSFIRSFPSFIYLTIYLSCIGALDRPGFPGLVQDDPEAIPGNAQLEKRQSQTSSRLVLKPRGPPVLHPHTASTKIVNLYHCNGTDPPLCRGGGVHSSSGRRGKRGGGYISNLNNSEA